MAGSNPKVHVEQTTRGRPPPRPGPGLHLPPPRPRPNRPRPCSPEAPLQRIPENPHPPRRQSRVRLHRTNEPHSRTPGERRASCRLAYFIGKRSSQLEAADSVPIYWLESTSVWRSRIDTDNHWMISVPFQPTGSFL